jgi:predicted SprT family Zn-dependent metalloprotease
MGFGGYMGVNNTNGHLMVNSRYLNSGDKTDIYLDVIHELCHVKQFMEGRELFDSRYDYVERPTEVEAYRYTVQEARRLGLSDKRICQYLKTEWMSDSDLKHLAKTLGVAC